MGLNPVNAWDTVIAVAQETVLGVPVAPASTTAYGLQLLEIINASVGPAEVGVIRPKQDRAQGRGQQSGWVEGRIVPIAWNVDTSLKTRAAVDTPSPLLPPTMRSTLPFWSRSVMVTEEPRIGIPPGRRIGRPETATGSPS